MQISTKDKEVEKLKETLSLSVTKKEGERTASIAYSSSGKMYCAGSVASDTNSLNISSEQAVLVLSALNTDYGIERIVTIREASGDTSLSPIVGKIIIDHSMRIEKSIEYKIVNLSGENIFESKDISKEFSNYKPEKIIIGRFQNSKFQENHLQLNISEPLELKPYAIQGLDRNFPLYDGASGYGTAVATKNGKVYFGGQYSSPDKRLGLHSEVTSILSALMDKNHEITDIGIVSSKYPDSPCDMCGICRQFISEICAKFDISPKLHCFSKDTDEYRTYKIKEYLPSSWTSKKWK